MKKKKEKRNASIVDEAARLKVEPKNNKKSVTQCFALLALNRNLKTILLHSCPLGPLSPYLYSSLF